MHCLELLHGCVDCWGSSKPCGWLCSLVRGWRLQGVLFAAMRHKLLLVSAGHVTICTCSLVGEGDLVHHCDSGVPEASMPVRSVELYPYVQSAFEQKTQLVSRLSKTATGAMAWCTLTSFYATNYSCPPWDAFDVLVACDGWSLPALVMNMAHEQVLVRGLWEAGLGYRVCKCDLLLSSWQQRRSRVSKLLDDVGDGLLDDVVDMQRRPAHAKPHFNWLSGPRNGTWKRTCGISCLRSLAPMRRLQCSTTQATFTNPSLLRLLRYSVVCLNSITQCNWHDIETMAE